MTATPPEARNLFTFVLPDPGEGLSSAELIEWNVTEQQTVRTDDPLLTVETAKATVEIPTPVSGKILRLLVAQGSIVSVGDPLVELEVDNESFVGVLHLVGRLPEPDDAPARRLPQKSAGSAAKVTPAVRRLARTLDVSLGGLTGTGPGGSITARDVENAAAASTEEP